MATGNLAVGESSVTARSEVGSQEIYWFAPRNSRPLLAGPWVYPALIAALRQLETKPDTNPPKKHGNIPL
jgi:hypothetical protein